MESTNHETNAANTRKRSPRILFAEVSSRGPLTRSKTALLNKAPEALDIPYDSQDEDIQTRESHTETRRPGSERGDWKNVDDQENSKNAVLSEGSGITAEMGQHFSGPSIQPKKQAFPRCSTPLPNRVAAQVRSLRNRPNVAAPSVAVNRQTFNGSSLEPPDFNDDEAPVSQNTDLLRPNIRRTAQQHIKESTKTRTSKTRCTGSPSTRVICSLRGFIILLIFSAVSFVIMSALWSSNDGGTHLSRAVKLQLFHEHLTNLKNDFPNQRYELWHRIKIHLTKHLKTAEPTEPVSLIFTAGRSAEKTLSCLALSVASSFSFALNASVHSIDGAEQAGLDSDEVKLDLDRQLQAAFEGEKPAVVIHHLEELPPSATLIFYRYCDHESAAYKKVLLLFTVLLPQEEVASDRSLKEVEELVHDRLLEKLVTSSEAVLNKMDANKFSGLWSRISHLILPVVSEEQTEKNGCKV